MFKKIKIAMGLDPIQKQLNDYIRRIPEINVLEPAYEKFSDDQLASKTPEFKKRLADGETLDDILPEAFAVVREAGKRVLGLRHYDVQMIGGMALNAGNIAEMKTGEGKTLVATLPVYLNALKGEGVHLVTVNDYLARRDARWMAPLYQLLGMSVGVLQMAARTDNGKNAFIVDFSIQSAHEDQNQLRIVPRKEAYNADITYGTNSEFGFDYLRDNMVQRLDERVQRGHAYAIVDEVDNVLIDEARTPLIISGPASDDVQEYYRMAQVVKQLVPDDYEVSEKDHQVYVNDNGMDHVEELLGMTLRDPSRPEEITIEQERMMGYLNQALSAQFLYHRNKEYLVQSGKVVIVDSFTGRLMPGRRWSNGLHQAIEAKEGVKVEPENVTYATITLQNFFRMYEKISGMTGTALTEKEEFYKIYQLDVIPIPTNLEYQAHQKNSGLVEREIKDKDGYKFIYYANPKELEKPLYYKRQDYPDLIYQTEEAKFRAITVEIMKNYVKGRPQLIGTASVEHSEFLSSRLKSEPLRRLVQVLMLRRAWMKKNNIEELDSPIKEFIPFNKPIQELTPNDLRPMAKQLELQLNPEDPDNWPFVKEEFDLEENCKDRFFECLQSGIPHQVLNARKHDEEGMIIANAGAFGAVTIATNMAGRGVDIKLGGELDDEVLLDTNRVLEKTGVDPFNMTMRERYDAVCKLSEEEYGLYADAVKTYKEYVENMDKVRALGGLHVIGSERHEARRIDNQLRGRAARQGDPGSSRFFLSLQDEIVRLFGGQKLEDMLKRIDLIDQNVALENSMFSRMIEQSQERVEGTNFDIRKHTLEYDDVLNTQRNRIYEQRNQAFIKKDLSEDIQSLLKTDLNNQLDKAESEEKWKLAAYLDSIQPAIQMDEYFLPSFSQKLIMNDLRKKVGDKPSQEELIKALVEFGREAFKIENTNGLELMETLITNSHNSYDAQLTERSDNFELFVNGLKDKIEKSSAAKENGEIVDNLRPQDILTEAGSFAKVQFRLSSDKQRQLTEGNEDVINELRGQIESALFTAYIQRLNTMITNRMSGDYIPPEDPIDTGDWETLSKKIMDSVQAGYTSRAEKLYGSQNQVENDLAASLASYKNNEPITDHQWTQLLKTMSEGQRIAFDVKTHRKTNKVYQRQNFIYFCGSRLEQLDRQQTYDLIWNHYMDAQEGLLKIFGKIDFARMHTNNVKLIDLKPETQKSIEATLGNNIYEQVKNMEVTEMPDEQQEKLREFLGNHIQNEINRQVLLRSISNNWVDYLTQIEALRVSISMESYGQRDPLVAYKVKGAEMYKELLNDIRQSVVERMFTALPTVSMLISSEKQVIEEPQNDSGKQTSENFETSSNQTAKKSDSQSKEKKNSEKQKRGK